MRGRWVFLRVGAALLLVVFAACDEPSDPGATEKVVDAIHDVSTWPGVTQRMSVETTAEDMIAALGPPADPRIAELFVDAVVVQSESQDSRDPAEMKSDTRVIVGGEEIVRFLTRGGSLYARVDLKLALDLLGTGESADQVAGQMLGAGVPRSIVSPLVRGDWMVVEDLADFVGPEALESEVASVAQWEALADGFSETASATSEGRDALGEHFAVTLPLDRALVSMAESLASTGSLPSGLPDFSAETLPDGEVELDMWVGDDGLERVQFDLRQLSQFGVEDVEDVEEFDVIVDLEEWDTSLRIPKHSVAIPPQLLLRLIQAAGDSSS